MFDAEVAATLLNRWASHTPTEECHAYLGLLREGNLHFTHKVGCMGMHGICDTGVCCTESLFFGDGSRALRVGAPDSETGWTRWAALQPLQ
ncbi:hypothetical protein [Paraburkholderia phytofirmans]|uniref:hypothetical protein n=1 Tax=Paraburkholderia phytofirmans TaxID=261302 RepID=UPI0038BD9DB9